MKNNTSVNALYLFLTMITVLFSCTEDEESPEAFRIELVSGENQEAEVNTQLNENIVFLVTDQNSTPFPDAQVIFSIEEGLLSSTSARTDNDGKISIHWTLGPTAGTHILTASSINPRTFSPLLGSPIKVDATATSPISCASDDIGDCHITVCCDDNEICTYEVNGIEYTSLEEVIDLCGG